MLYNLPFNKNKFHNLDIGFANKKKAIPFCQTDSSLDFFLQTFDLQWFAAEDEGRTEDPTEYKIRKAREEGRVPKSQELSSALNLLFPTIVLIVLAPWLINQLVEMLHFFLTISVEDSQTGQTLFITFLNYFLKCMLPLAITAMVTGIASNVIQNGGFLFTTKPIEPKFSKVAPNFAKYFKRTLFSAEGAFNSIKSLFKIAVIAIVAFITIRNEIPVLVELMQTGIWNALTYIGSMSSKLLLTSALIFCALSIPDYIFQRYSFKESLKMTKQEVKEEYKMLEGDPEIKSRQYARMMEIYSQNIRRIVPQADVVITNPTHFAIAIVYEAGMEAPKVIAKGQDEMAQRIKAIARENGIVMVENRPLARALYTNTKINDTIPTEYFAAVATILQHVYMIDAKKRYKAFKK